MPPATLIPRGDDIPRKGPHTQRRRCPLRLGDDGGVWAFSAAATLSLAMLGALAGALDVASVGYARLRLWSALSTTARAAARCLADPSGSQSTTAPAVTSSLASVGTCVDAVSAQVFHEDAATGLTSPGAVSAQWTVPPQTGGTGASGAAVPPSVTIQASAVVRLPFPLPGVTGVSLTESATASLVSVPRSGSSSGASS